MRDSDAVRIAKISARTQLRSQVVGIVTDPVWSTIAGFVAIHELRKHDMIGPVADDVLYAGLITINASRIIGGSNLAGSNLVPSLIESAGAGAIAGKLAGGAAGAAGAGAAGAGAGAAGAAGTGLAGALGIGALAAGGNALAQQVIPKLMSAEDRKIYNSIPAWARYGAPLIAEPMFLAKKLKSFFGK